MMHSSGRSSTMPSNLSKEYLGMKRMQEVDSVADASSCNKIK